MNKQPEREPNRAPPPLWECPNCGQQHFGDSPPDMCDYCHDFTTWRRVPRRSKKTDESPKPTS